MNSDRYYLNLERQRERDPLSDGVMPMSSGWRKYHPDQQLVMVEDLDGKQRWITPTQHRVLMALRHLADAYSERVSFTAIAASLGIATSTATRAAVRLAAFGLVSYDITRGRTGGVVVLRQLAANARERAQAAWASIRRATEARWAAWHRRLIKSGYRPEWLIVATIEVVDATFSWTAQDMASVDLEYGL